MRRDHHNALCRDAVGCGDRIGDLIAYGDHPFAACHHAVVDVLEDFLLAKSVVPRGYERYAGHAGRKERTPRRRARKRMHGGALMLQDEMFESERIAGDDQWIAARHIEPHRLGADEVLLETAS